MRVILGDLPQKIRPFFREKWVTEGFLTKKIDFLHNMWYTIKEQCGADTLCLASSFLTGLLCFIRTPTVIPLKEGAPITPEAKKQGFES